MAGSPLALTESLVAQLAHLGGAGARIAHFLSMVQLGEEQDAAPAGDGPAVASGRVRKVIEQDLDARLRDLFADFDDEPFAFASLGQVHRARTRDGDDVSVKVQHPGAAEAIEADLRNLGLVGPVIRALAPAVDAGAVLAEIRDRISDELDYEAEAQHQRRLERLYRGHPHVRLPHVHTELSARRVLVTEYVDGLRGEELGGLGEAERDRIGEIAFRFFLGLAWRDGIAAGDPDAGKCILCPDGRLCLLDFGLMRDLEPSYREGELAVMRAVARGDAERVHDGLARLGYLQPPESFERAGLLAHLAAAGDWMLAPGFRRIHPQDVARVLQQAYPPHSGYLGQMLRMSIPPATLLLRRTEVRVLGLLGRLRSGGEWGAIAAEHHTGTPPATGLGREDAAFHARRAC